LRRYNQIKTHILTREELGRQCNMWRMLGKKIVFTNGCFDLIHLGHIDYLARAANLGDVLVIGLNSDASVKRLKGQGRPINNEESRQLVLAGFRFVDAVSLFEEDTPAVLIEIVKPDFLVKGGDYREENVVGADIVKKRGGKVIILPYLEGYSTTRIEETIRKF
jgi:D-glycero-beta-D-manno-heptose 1-phosphate adenylyltransferase